VQESPWECTFPPTTVKANLPSLFIPGVAVVSTWFKRRRAFALGIVASGSSVGAVIYPITLEKLIPQIGFAWSVRTIALIMIATLAISNLTLRSRLPPRKAGPLIEPKAFLQPSYSLYTVGAFLAFWGLYTPFFYSTSYMQKIGAPENVSLYVLSLMNVPSSDSGGG
jgi:predicted MFS family arabinose efflux permease